MLDSAQPDLDQLAEVAVQLVERVRTDHPMRLWRELVAPLDGPETAALVMLLAAAVDPSVHPDIWWTWVRHREVLERAAPIVWDEGEVPIEDMGSAQITELIGRLSGRGRTAREISDEIGLSFDAVAKRLERLRRRDKAGVG